MGTITVKERNTAESNMYNSKGLSRLILASTNINNRASSPAGPARTNNSVKNSRDGSHGNGCHCYSHQRPMLMAGKNKCNGNHG